ncbi:MAG: 6-phospho-3-hexuloisomerase [Pseudomonadota bacterium]
MQDVSALAEQALSELRAVARGLLPGQLDAAAAAIVGARRIALYGVGREGLMIKALGMRLYHLGLDAHVVGEMGTPPLGPGDLLLVSAGPGDFATVAALVTIAHKAGAKTLCFTAQRDGPVPMACDLVCLVPAQTMADDRESSASVLPMGSLYEGALFLLFELLVLDLHARLGETPDSLRARHTNLE